MINKDYLEHNVFEQLQYYADFYTNLALRIMGFIPHGTNKFFNIDTYMYTSIQGTLESIKNILKNGRINDSYTLLRKYYDSIIINIYSILYLKDNFTFEKFVVEQIDNWIKGKDRLPEFRTMSKYIKSSNQVSGLNKLIEKDFTYMEIRNRCNDHTHYNSYRYVVLNDNSVYNPNQLTILDSFSKDLRNLFIFHLSYVFYLNEYYMSSDDFIMSLEEGLTPEDNSQYYVASFIQDMFDKEIKKYRTDLYELIKSTTSMMLN